MKKELEQLKQEVYRLKNAKEELEGDLKREQENNKRLDPQLLCDLEERHKTEVSKIKRKQWVSEEILVYLLFLLISFYLYFSVSFASLKRLSFGKLFYCIILQLYF